MKYLDDGLVVVGCAAMVYGVSLVSVAAAWIAAGVFCVALGVALGVLMSTGKVTK